MCLSVCLSSVKPYISHMPVSTRLPVGSDARLTCRAWGYEEPKVTWYRDGKLIQSQARLRMLAHSDADFDAASSMSNVGKVLAIRGLIEDDRGVYNCTAVNGHGKASRHTVLRVTGRLYTQRLAQSVRTVTLHVGYLCLDRFF